MSKKILITFLLVGLLFLATGFLLSFPQNFGFCISDDWVCISDMSDNYGESFIFWAIYFLIAVIFVRVFNASVYTVWKKFTFVYVPLSVLLIAFVPVYCGGSYVEIFCLNKENSTWLTSIGFLVITLILIISKKLKSKSGQN